MDTIETKCLICDVPVTEVHLGINSCRACAVFYKRTVNSSRALKCKSGNNDCIQDNPTTSCRKCRFVRFSDIYAKACEEVEIKATEEDEQQNDVRKDSTGSENPEGKSYKFIDHDSYLHTTPSGCSETPIIDALRQAYSLMCKIRKSGEFGTYLGVDCNAPLRSSKQMFFPSTYSRAIPNARIMYSVIIDFGDAAFEDYRKLEHDSKVFIASSANALIAVLDASYRATHYFPDDDTIFVSYTIILNLDNLASFFDDCPHDFNKEEVVNEFRKNLTRSQIANKAEFKKFRPTEKEFLALLGLSLWNNDIFTMNEKLMKIVAANRDAILKELHVMYWNEGLPNYATRLGELLCLLVNIEKTAFQSKEETEVYRLMNLFNEAFNDGGP